MPIFDALPNLPLRPDGTPAATITITQGFHEWVHALEAQGWDIADGSRGKPSYPADTAALDAMRAALVNPGQVAPYGTSPLGEPRLRAQAARGLLREYGVEISPEHVAFTPGGQFGLAGTFHAIEQARPGGVVLAANPWYLNHEELASMFVSERMLTQARRPKFVAIDTLPYGGRLVADAWRTAIAELAREGRSLGAFLFCNPSNPTGIVTRRAEWEAMAEVLREHPDVPIVMDEAFTEVVFDHDSSCSLLHAAPDLLPRCFLFRSGTKALGLAGERLAAQVVPPAYLASFTAFQSRLLGNPALSMQAGMAAALETMGAEKKRAITDYYLQNFEFLRARLQSFGLWREEIITPEGGFFVLLPIPQAYGLALPAEAAQLLGKERIESDRDLSFALLFGLGQPAGAKRGVATIPASAFGLAPERMTLRVSYSSTREEIAAITERLGALG